MYRSAAIIIFLAVFLVSCGEGNSVSGPFSKAELEEAVKSGTAAKVLEPDERIIEAAKYASELDDKALERYKDPDRCPYGTGSWDWWWSCKDGKLIKK